VVAVVVQWTLVDGRQVEVQKLLIGLFGQVGFEHDLDPGRAVLQDENLGRLAGLRTAIKNLSDERFEMSVGVVGEVFGDLVEERF